MKNLKELVNEYHKLKSELFGGAVFVIADKENEKWKRYNQLFQFLHPQFRTSNFVNPVS